MQRIAAKISFVGSEFHGWQKQNNATTVQGCVENVLSILYKQPVSVMGCGRTDTGVHAKFFVLHFDAPFAFALEDLVYKCNALLPKSIAFIACLEMQPEFHARFDATSRTYEYHCHFGKQPFIEGFSMPLIQQPNVALMNEAAQFFIGKQDFTSMAKLHGGNKTNICDVRVATWQQLENKWIFTITADRFLRNMVRATVGTLLNVGFGKIKPNQVLQILEAKNRSAAGNSVKACGLYLTDITYPNINGISNKQ